MSTSKNVRYRRADNGEYTTAKYAAKHPKTTVRETDRSKGRAKK